MNNDELRDLLNSIESAVNNDAMSGNHVTTYTLSDDAFTEKVLDVLSEKLQGYKDVRIDGSNLVLTHTDK
ncbi:MAG: hypothetical protein QNK26_16490 [Moritella sp.]|uniref:hypothetical protein n=1 Tax=Moritella sp. TaxID=78556 RepID=UPI0029A95E51|nr:hypothetical protein [Moritella sp.]MDX2322185.1 hypothetical protein [Moritella sp.]